MLGCSLQILFLIISALSVSGNKIPESGSFGATILRNGKPPAAHPFGFVENVCILSSTQNGFRYAVLIQILIAGCGKTILLWVDE
jgi:hypothetical protein